MQIAVLEGYRVPRKKKGRSMKGKKNPKLAAASKHCRLKGVKPFTKSFGSCMKAYFKKGR